jgi:putative NIF3 family GTP cyclohydrolase 1 type 2
LITSETSEHATADADANKKAPCSGEHRAKRSFMTNEMMEKSDLVSLVTPVFLFV